MPKFAANLSMLFTELAFIDRIAAAAAAGFAAVECQFPYDHPAEEIARSLARRRVKMVLDNLPAGDWAAGDRGIAAVPGREAEFRDGVGQGIAYARTLGCPRLNCLAGVVAPPDREEAHEVLLGNLRFAAAALENAGLELLIEPINSRDVPEFFVNRSRQAVAIIEAVKAPNLKLQLDLYHAQIMDGELSRTLEVQLPWIGHVQIADAPGRHEPGTGEIDYALLFEDLDTLGYDGWVGCEYRPLTTTTAGLVWFSPYRVAVR